MCQEKQVRRGSQPVPPCRKRPTRISDPAAPALNGSNFYAGIWNETLKDDVVHNVISGVWFMGFISFRSEEKLRKDAQELALLERRSQSDEYREIFAAGIAEKRKQVALREYAAGTASFGRAVDVSGLDAWSFAELLREKGVSLNLSAKDILAQAKGL